MVDKNLISPSDGEQVVKNFLALNKNLLKPKNLSIQHNNLLIDHENLSIKFPALNKTVGF